MTQKRKCSLTDSFNLVSEPWITCLDHNGQPHELSLRDVLVDAHNLREIYDASPLVIASLMRLLLAILHRIYGPETVEDWVDLWEMGHFHPSYIDDYFEAWRDRFELLEPDPSKRFYQSQSEDPKDKPKSIIHLVISTGNNPVLFTHKMDRDANGLTPSEAARTLVTAHNYRLGGLLRPGASSPDGTSSRGLTFLFAGEDLFQTLMLNLVGYEARDTFPVSESDSPAWEQDDAIATQRNTITEKRKLYTLPNGYLDFLTWQSLRIWLHSPDDDGLIRQVTLGLSGSKLHWSVQNPMYHYRKAETKDPSGLRELRMNLNRALWRDSASLLRPNSTDDFIPPATIRWLAQLEEYSVIDFTTPYLMALGMSSHQAKVFAFGLERFPLPTIYLREEGLVEILDWALERTNQVAGALRNGLMVTAELVLSSTANQARGRKPDLADVHRLRSHWGVERVFWAGLEPHFHELLNILPSDEDAAIERWITVIRRQAWEAFDHLQEQVGQDSKGIKAITLGRQQLGIVLQQALQTI